MISHLGARARHILSQNPHGRVQGGTSRGLFLAFPREEIIFISRESMKGPLTLNLRSEARFPFDLPPGSPVEASPGELFFPTTGRALSFAGAQTWQPAPPPNDSLDRPGLHARLARLVQAVAAGARPGGGAPFHSAPLLAGVAGLLDGSPDRETHPDLWHLYQALREVKDPGDPEKEELRAALTAFLGRGGGLTPAGDDLVTGLFLVLNRWQAFFGSRAWTGSLATAILSAASQKTTSLSANLIACAAAGQADERLILALDGLMTGWPSLDACAESLLAWGSSSGSDALAGMALAVMGLQGDLQNGAGCYPAPYEEIHVD